MKTWGNDSAVQKWMPGSVTLATIGTSSAPPTPADVYFKVPTPDSRLRVKISVYLAPPAGYASEFDITGFATLWLAEVEYESSGVSGRDILCTNIEGSESSPTAVPASAPLLGYSREFVTAADAIQGKFSILANITQGSWILQTRYQPDSVRFSEDEWREIITQAGRPTILTPALSF